MRDVELERVMVIGMGEVGRRLADSLERAGVEVYRVSRLKGWKAVEDPKDPSPRIVAVREGHLGEVLGRIPMSLRNRLVLVQNGFLEAVHGDLGPVTRGLIYFTSKGEFFEVLCPSPFHGPMAATLVPPLEAAGLPSELLEETAPFLQAMIAKGLWNAVVGLPLAVHEITLDEYYAGHADELRALLEEGAAAAGRWYGVEIDSRQVEEHLRRTTRSLGWVRGGAKALPWRNGALAWFGRQRNVPTPVNDRLLRAVGYDPSSHPHMR